MAKQTEQTRRQRHLTTVQIGKRHIPKVQAIANQMDVTNATVVKWAIDAFDLDIFLATRQLELTAKSNQPEPAVV